MNKIKLLLPLGLFMLIVIFLWRGLQSDPHVIPSPLIGKKVPEFQAYSIFNSQKIITQKIFEGHVSVLNIFATWCTSCKAEHPMLMDLAQQNKTVWMIGMSFKDESKEVIDYLKKEGNPYRIVIDDASGNLGINFGLYGTPETFVIDQQGIVRDKIIGPISPDILKNKLVPLIKKLESRKSV